MASRGSSRQASLATLAVGAKVMGVLTKDEFTKGFVEIGVADVAALRARLPALRAQLSDAAFFRAWGSRRASCTYPAKYRRRSSSVLQGAFGLGLTVRDRRLTVCGLLFPPAAPPPPLLTPLQLLTARRGRRR